MTARYTGLVGIREQPREIANCANLRAAARGRRYPEVTLIVDVLEVAPQENQS
jgi:hypothetical protein